VNPKVQELDGLREAWAGAVARIPKHKNEEGR